MPKEIIELPSKGLLYPESSPLSSGKVEMRYMSTEDEDILTNRNYINDDSVFNRLLKSVLVDKSIDLEDLLLGDKNALLMACRILGYGPEYTIYYNRKPVTIDLQKLKHKEVDFSLFKKGENNFEYTLPYSGNKVTFRLMTEKLEKLIEADIAGYKKIDPKSNPSVSVKTQHIITSIEGNTSREAINDFVKNSLLPRDRKALYKYMESIEPDIDMSYEITISDDQKEVIEVPITTNFFWPED